MARNNAQASALAQCIAGRNKLIMEAKDSKKEIIGHHQEWANNQ